MAEKEWETILVQRDGRVGTITLNRPQALNALNSQMMNDVTSAATELDGDQGIGAIIITGSAKAFAAGADIKEMSDKSYAQMFLMDFFAKGARRIEQLGVQRVQCFGPVQPDQGDRVGRLDQQGFIGGHRRRSFRRGQRGGRSSA